MTAQTELEALLARAQQLADADRCSSVASVAAPKDQNQPAGAANPARKSILVHATAATSLQKPWEPEDWSAFFDERAGIREHDGRQTPQEAEGQALAETIEHWRALHPMPPSGPEIGCVHCGKGVGDPTLVPHLASGRGAFWLHTTCWPAFDRARREEALAALRQMWEQPDRLLARRCFNSERTAEAAPAFTDEKQMDAAPPRPGKDH